MVEEAEQFKQEDNLMRERIETKNTLENYLYSTKSSITDQIKIHIRRGR